MSRDSISIRPGYSSARSCNPVLALSCTVPTTFQPLVRNSAAMARPRPRDALRRRIVGTLSLDGRMRISFALKAPASVCEPVGERQTHPAHKIVASDAMAHHADPVVFVHGHYGHEPACRTGRFARREQRDRGG